MAQPVVGPSATGPSVIAASIWRRRPGASGSGTITVAAPPAAAPIAPVPSLRASRAAIVSTISSPGIAAPSAIAPAPGSAGRSTVAATSAATWRGSTHPAAAAAVRIASWAGGGCCTSSRTSRRRRRSVSPADADCSSA